MHTSNAVLAWANTVHGAVDEARSELGLDPRELAALTLATEHEGCTMDWLRQRIGLTQSGTVRLVDRLTARGLVERVLIPGRTVPLRLTAAGAGLLKAWAGARDRSVDDLLAGLSAEQCDQFLSAIRVALQTTPRDRRTADAACGSCTWPACGTDCPVDLSVSDESR